MIKRIIFYLGYLFHYLLSYRNYERLQLLRRRLYVAWLSAEFKHIGYPVNWYPPVRTLRGGKYISIGDKVSIGKNVTLTAWNHYQKQRFTPEITIGNNSSIGDESHITAINKIWIEIPKSQLNFYTEIINKNNGSKIIFRNELRYSHGQFNGTPEAKCYIDRNACDLTTMYEKIV